MFHFERDRERIFDHLSQQLKSINTSLCFEFGPEVGGRREFILSADGDRAAFPDVQRLAAAAPPLDKWVVIPFRPPKDISRYDRVRYAGYEVTIDDIWFSFEEEGNIVHLDLFIKGLRSENDASLGGAAFLLLDSALGEYVVETRVGGIARHPLPTEPAAEGLLPLRELLNVVRLKTH